MSPTHADERGIVLTCPSCGQANRIPYERLNGQTRCGRCKSQLAAPATPVEASTASAFDAAITRSPLPVIVDFWAPWCGPCRMVAPELVKVAAANAGRWLLLKVNTEQVPDVGNRFNIRSIPTLAVFRAGAEVGRTAGAMPAQQIEAFVSKTLA